MSTFKKISLAFVMFFVVYCTSCSKNSSAQSSLIDSSAVKDFTKPDFIFFQIFSFNNSNVKELLEITKQYDTTCVPIPAYTVSLEKVGPTGTSIAYGIAIPMRSVFELYPQYSETSTIYFYLDTKRAGELIYNNTNSTLRTYETIYLNFIKKKK